MNQESLMNKEQARAKWLKQLRSPTARKVTEALESYDCELARCCLGHANYALGQRKWKSDDDVWYGDPAGSSTRSSLTKEAAMLLDITPQGFFKEPIPVQPGWHPVSIGIETIPNLVILNDTTILEPVQIADVIEEQFEKDNFRPYLSYSSHHTA